MFLSRGMQSQISNGSLVPEFMPQFMPLALQWLRGARNTPCARGPSGCSRAHAPPREITLLVFQYLYHGSRCNTFEDWSTR